MTKLRLFWHRIPRKAKAIGNLLLIAAALFAMYVSLDCPTLTVESQFRRAEKAHLVGPSTILGIEELSGTNFDSLLLADTGDGIILYSFNRNDRFSTLTYRDKMGDVSVLAATIHSLGILEHSNSVDFPIAVFDSFPQAMYAELDITLTAAPHRDFQKNYTLKAERTNPGYFLFRINTDGTHEIGAEGWALEMFAVISRDNSYRSYVDLEIPATVRFYDETANLICQHTLTIRSVAAEARPDELLE